ncbi:D-tyrosyl-tRNA(Tyr) deacylase [Nonlabens mediterrranea]|uniref:D-aminoacyl-tRNA deacylase n=1 Tax=Nonlabens mediterrranea TaxID=1419947 RepID=A0ABS0A289_9FLAO|nr:D-Tyr-tRNA tyr deacylase [Flavobacteria bacterium BBFL7]MBF4983019.1 D-tyrosyl-tRNA(Tyr) deacylase [Nonlabens mediterrranea]
MKVVLQRVSEASVTINGQVHGAIDHGLLVLLGITIEDTQEDIDWLVNKIAGMRIFSDQDGKMNLNVVDVSGNALVISQFTLFASTKKGNRPSFLNAARPEVAIPLYESFVETLSRKLNKTIPTGKFGADMKVALVNDGPVTIVVDSKNKL